MSTGYVRQSSGLITDGASILASHHNNEYNALEGAFAAATGHNHDGTAGAGAKIPLTTGIIGILPIANGGTNAITASAARANLGLAIGTDVQAFDADLSAIAGLTSAADKLPYFTGASTAAVTTLTTYGRSLIDDADATTARTTLGLGSIATQAASAVAITGGTLSSAAISGGTIATAGISGSTITGGSISGIADLSIADGGTGASTASSARSNLGLTLGTDVQAFDATLAALAGVSTTTDSLIYATSSDTFATTTLTSFGRSLIDDVDAATARSTLGLAIGTNVQASDPTLTALAAYNTNGLVVQTSADTFAGRTLTGTTNKITVTNGDGVSGNPTLNIGSDVVTLTDSQTLTNKTLTAPSISSPKITTAINDSLNNELIVLTSTASAVNEITITNAATGNAPTISATGSDANVGFILKAKAEGDFLLTNTASGTESFSVGVRNNGTGEAVTDVLVNNNNANGLGGQFRSFAKDSAAADQLLSAFSGIIRKNTAGAVNSTAILYNVLAGGVRTGIEVGSDASGNNTYIVNNTTMGGSLTINGYIRIPISGATISSIILQWGRTVVAGDTTVTVTLPISFPNAALVGVCSPENPGFGDLDGNAAGLTPINPSQVNIKNTGGPTNVNWFVIGY